MLVYQGNFGGKARRVKRMWVKHRKQFGSYHLWVIESVKFDRTLSCGKKLLNVLLVVKN